MIIKLFAFCGHEVSLILMLILVQFENFDPTNRGGGLNTSRITPETTHSVFKGYVVYPSFWASFIAISAVACINLLYRYTPLCVMNVLISRDQSINQTNFI